MNIVTCEILSLLKFRWYGIAVQLCCKRTGYWFHFKPVSLYWVARCGEVTIEFPFLETINCPSRVLYKPLWDKQPSAQSDYGRAVQVKSQVTSWSLNPSLCYSKEDGSQSIWEKKFIFCSLENASGLALGKVVFRSRGAVGVQFCSLGTGVFFADHMWIKITEGWCVLQWFCCNLKALLLLCRRCVVASSWFPLCPLKGPFQANH